MALMAAKTHRRGRTRARTSPPRRPPGRRAGRAVAPSDASPKIPYQRPGSGPVEDQPLGCEQPDRQRAPDSRQPVRAQRTDRVVEVLVDQQHAVDDDHSGHRSDDRRGPELDIARRGGDSDEPGDRAVAGHADVERLRLQPDDQRRGDGTGGCRELRVQRHLGEEVVARPEGRARVEPVPADPQQQHAEADDRHRVPRYCPWLSIRPVLPRRAPRSSRAARPPTAPVRWTTDDPAKSITGLPPMSERRPPP